jgi:hypothetical protein
MEFRFVTVVPKYLNCSTLSNDLLSIFVMIFVLRGNDADRGKPKYLAHQKILHELPWY